MECLDCPGVTPPISEFGRTRYLLINSETAVPTPVCTEQTFSKSTAVLRDHAKGFFASRAWDSPHHNCEDQNACKEHPDPRELKDAPLRCHESAYPRWRSKSKSHHERIGVTPLQIVTKCHIAGFYPDSVAGGCRTRLSHRPRLTRCGLCEKVRCRAVRTRWSLTLFHNCGDTTTCRASTLTIVGHIEDAFIWARHKLFPNSYFCFFVMK
jgi:hypothetical protein